MWVHVCDWTASKQVTEWIEGDNLLEFTRKAHELMDEGRLSRKDWSKTVKYILWQLTATIRWLHVVFRCM